MFVVVIPSVNDQFIGKIDNSYMKRRKVYKDASEAFKEVGRQFQSKKEGFGVGLGNFSSPPFFSLSCVIFTTN